MCSMFYNEKTKRLILLYHKVLGIKAFLGSIPNPIDSFRDWGLKAGVFFDKVVVSFFLVQHPRALRKHLVPDFSGKPKT